MHPEPTQLHGGDGGVNPTPESLETLRAAHGDGPVQMINLLKFCAVADYPPGHEHEGSTGEEAYGRYGQVALRSITGLGGRLVLLSRFDSEVIGEPGEDWDQVAVIEYPSVDAFFALSDTDGYLEATAHRTAGLERTRLIATTAVLDASAG